jgi:hypothetical protein
VLIPGFQKFALDLSAALAGLTVTEAIAYIAFRLTIEYIKYEVLSFISEEFVEFLVKELGLEVSAQVVALITLAASLGLGAKGGDEIGAMLSLSRNFNDAYVKYTGDLADQYLQTFETERAANEQFLQDLKDDYGDLLKDVNPNWSLATKMYLIADEEPSEFFSRTIENKNPGVATKDVIESQITRWKYLAHDEEPIIVTDEPSSADILDNTV